MSAASSNWMQLPALSDSRIGHVAVAAVYDRRFFLFLFFGADTAPLQVRGRQLSDRCYSQFISSWRIRGPIGSLARKVPARRFQKRPAQAKNPAESGKRNDQ